MSEIRAEAGLTQAAFAERADISLRYLQLVEAGQRNLTFRTALNFTRALGCRLIDLLHAPRTLDVARGRPMAGVRKRAKRRSRRSRSGR